MLNPRKKKTFWPQSWNRLARNHLPRGIQGSIRMESLPFFFFNSRKTYEAPRKRHNFATIPFKDAKWLTSKLDQIQGSAFSFHLELLFKWNLHRISEFLKFNTFSTNTLSIPTIILRTGSFLCRYPWLFENVRVRNMLCLYQKQLRLKSCKTLVVPNSYNYVLSLLLSINFVNFPNCFWPY